MAALDAADAALRLDHTFVNAIRGSRALVNLKHLDSAGASFAMARYLEPQCGAGPTPDWARQYSYLWSAPLARRDWRPTRRCMFDR